jgi:hypothetical protein
MFFALECLLNELAPVTSGEREADWFKRALAVADTLVPAAELAPVHETDPIEWVYQNIYRNERSALVHAKRNYLLPQDANARESLGESVQTLANYVHKLVDKHLGVSLGRSSLTAATRRSMLEAVLAHSKLYVSDDNSPACDGDDSDDHPAAAGAHVATAAATQFVMRDKWLGVVSASWDASVLNDIGAVCRMGFILDSGKLGGYSELRGPLELGTSVSRFALNIGLRTVDGGAPRRHFRA